jgi:pimeloyl-ACP methyl ester carboxylesterase
MERRERRELSPDHTLELQWESNQYLFHFDAEAAHLPTDVDIETVVLDLDNTQRGMPERSVIVLGGVGEDVDIMKPFLLAMAKEGVQVVGLSLPSYGGSSDADARWRKHPDGTEKDTFADYSAVIEAVRKRLEASTTMEARPMQKKIDIVGHSLGGAIVAEYAATHPDTIASVHLMAPAGRSSYDRGKLPVSPKLLLEVVAMQGKERFAQWLKRIGTKESAPDVMSHMWIDNFLKNNTQLDLLNDVSSKKTNIRAVQRFWEGAVAGEGRLDQHIATMKKEGLIPHVYAAEADQLFPPASFTGIEDVGASLTVLDNMAHYGILDQSERCAKIIRSNMNS